MYKNDFKFRTDIAPELIENKDTFFASGVTSEVRRFEHGILLHHVKLDEKNTLDRIAGAYITIDSPQVESAKAQQLTSELLAKVLQPYLEGKQNVLVIGIGNRGLTSDSLGPKSIEYVDITRGVGGELLPNLLHKKNSLPIVSVYAPNVLGKTGIESFDVVLGLVNAIKPDIVLVIDSLCSRKISRIGTSFQMTDVGILPGSGIAASTSELSIKTLGVPTIAIGVPMVVYASELAFELLFDELLNGRETSHRLKRKLNIPNKTMVVTPKDVDEIVDRAAIIISNAINLALYTKPEYYKH